MRKIYCYFINVIFIIIVFLFIIDNTNGFDLINPSLKNLIYQSYILGGPIMIFFNWLFIRTKKQLLIWTTLPVLVITSVFILRPHNILMQSGAWVTQTELYYNQQHPDNKIVFQMQDTGAFGYDKRTVEIKPFLGTIVKVSTVDTSGVLDKKWVKSDKFVNGLKLMEP